MDPYALNDDGTAKDPVAFREALRSDPTKMQALEQEPEVAKIILGHDISAFQELIKSVYQVCPCFISTFNPSFKSFQQAIIPPTDTLVSILLIRYDFYNVLQAEKKRMERANKGMAERTIDAQRVSATVPRDTVQLYAQLRESGLQYGPAFRLLRNVHTPDVAST